MATPKSISAHAQSYFGKITKYKVVPKKNSPGTEAYRPEGTCGEPGLYVGACSKVHRSERAGGNPYMHVGSGPVAHKPEGAGGDSYIHVGAGTEATGLRGPEGTRKCT